MEITTETYTMETRASTSSRRRRREAAPTLAVYRYASADVGDDAAERGYYDATASHDGERCRALLLRLLRDVAAFARQQQLRLQSEPQPPAPHAAIWIHAVARVCDDRVDRLQRCGTHDVASYVLAAATTPTDFVAEAMVQELLVSLLKIRLGETEALVLDEVENVESLRVLRGELERDEATLRRAVREGAGDETQLTQLQLLLREAFVTQLAQTRAQGLADALHNESSLQFAWETIQDQKREIQRLRAENEQLQTTMAAPSEVPAVPQHAEVDGDMRRSIQQLQLQLSSHPYTRLPLMEAQLSLLEAAMGQRDGTVEQSRHTVTTSGATLSLSRDDLDLGESLRGSVLLPSHLTLSSMETPARECPQCRRYRRAYVECHADNKRLRTQAAADEDALARAEQAYANIKNEHAALTSALLAAKEKQEELRRMIVDVTDEKLQFQTRHEAQQRTSDHLVAQLQRQLSELERSRERSERERLDASICQEALENEVQRLKTTVQQLEKERSALVDDRQKLQLEVADLKKEASAVTRGADAAASALATAQRELESARQRLEAAQTQVLTLENAIKGYERARQELSDAEAIASRRAGHLQSERNMLAESVQRLRQKIEALKKDSSDAAVKAEEKIQSLAIQADRDRHESEQLKLSQATLQEESDLLLDGVRRLKQEVEDLQEEKASQEVDAIEAREALTVAERESASVRQTLEATRLTISQQHSTTENLLETLKERTSSETAALQRVEQLHTERNALVASLEQLRNEAADLKAELGRRTTAADETQQALAAAEYELAIMKRRSDEELAAGQVLLRRQASIGMQSSPSTCSVGVQTLHSMCDEPQTTQTALLDEGRAQGPPKTFNRSDQPQERDFSDHVSTPRDLVHDVRTHDPLIANRTAQMLDEDSYRRHILRGEANAPLRGVHAIFRVDGEPSPSNSTPSYHDENSDGVDLLAVSNDGLLTETPRERQFHSLDTNSLQEGLTVPQKAADESRHVEQAERVLHPDAFPAKEVSRGRSCGADDHSVDVSSDAQTQRSVDPAIATETRAEVTTTFINDALAISTSRNDEHVSSKWAAIVGKLLLRSARTDLLSIVGGRLRVQSHQTRIHNRWALLVTRLLSWTKVHALQAMLTVTTSELRWSKQHHEAAKQKQEDLRKLIVELTNEKMKTQSLYESQQQERASGQRHLAELEQALETSVLECEGAVASRDVFEKELMSVTASAEELRKERDLLVHTLDRLRKQRVQSPTKVAVANTVNRDGGTLSTTELEVMSYRDDHNAQPRPLEVSRNESTTAGEFTHGRNQRLELEPATPTKMRELQSPVELQVTAVVADESGVEAAPRQSSRGVQTAVISLLTREAGVQTDRNELTVAHGAEKANRPVQSDHGESTTCMERMETKAFVQADSDEQPRQRYPARDDAVCKPNVQLPSVVPSIECDLVYDIPGHDTHTAAIHIHQIHDPRSHEDARSHPCHDVPKPKQATPADAVRHEPRLEASSNAISSCRSGEQHVGEEERDRLDGCDVNLEQTSAHSDTAQRVLGTSDHRCQFEASQGQCSRDKSEISVDDEPRSESFSRQHDSSSGAAKAPTTGERACVSVNEGGDATSKGVLVSTMTGNSPASIDELVAVKKSIKEAQNTISQHQSTIARLEDALMHQAVAEEAALAQLRELLGVHDRSVESAALRSREPLAPLDGEGAVTTDTIGSVAGALASTQPSLLTASRGSELVEHIQQLQQEMTALKHELATAQITASQTNSVLLTTRHELEAATRELELRGLTIETLTGTVDELSQSKAVACSRVRLLQEQLAQQGARVASEDMGVQTSIATRIASVQTAPNAQPTSEKGSEHDGQVDAIQAVQHTNRTNTSDSDQSQAGIASPGSSVGTTPRYPSLDCDQDIFGSASVSVSATEGYTVVVGERGCAGEVVVSATDEGASAVITRIEGDRSRSLKAAVRGSEFVEHIQQLEQEMAALKHELATAQVSASETSRALLANVRELQIVKQRLEVATEELERRGSTIETLTGTVKELSQSEAAACVHSRLLEEELARQCVPVSSESVGVQTSIATRTSGAQTVSFAPNALVETSRGQPAREGGSTLNAPVDANQAVHQAAARTNNSEPHQSEVSNAPQGSSDGSTRRYPLLDCDDDGFGSSSVCTPATELTGKHDFVGETRDFSRVERSVAVGEHTEDRDFGRNGPSDSYAHHSTNSATCSGLEAECSGLEEVERIWQGADGVNDEVQRFDGTADQEDVFMPIEAGSMDIGGELRAYRSSSHPVASSTPANSEIVADVPTAQSLPDVRGEVQADLEQLPLSRVVTRSSERLGQASFVDASELASVTMRLEAARQEIAMYQATVARLTAAVDKREEVDAAVSRDVSPLHGDGGDHKKCTRGSQIDMADSVRSSVASTPSAEENAGGVYEPAVVPQESRNVIVHTELEAQEKMNCGQHDRFQAESSTNRHAVHVLNERQVHAEAVLPFERQNADVPIHTSEGTTDRDEAREPFVALRHELRSVKVELEAAQEQIVLRESVIQRLKGELRKVVDAEERARAQKERLHDERDVLVAKMAVLTYELAKVKTDAEGSAKTMLVEKPGLPNASHVGDERDIADGTSSNECDEVAGYSGVVLDSAAGSCGVFSGGRIELSSMEQSLESAHREISQLRSTIDSLKCELQERSKADVTALTHVTHRSSEMIEHSAHKMAVEDIPETVAANKKGSDRTEDVVATVAGKNVAVKRANDLTRCLHESDASHEPAAVTHMTPQTTHRHFQDVYEHRVVDITADSDHMNAVDEEIHVPSAFGILDGDVDSFQALSTDAHEHDHVEEDNHRVPPAQIQSLKTTDDTRLRSGDVRSVERQEVVAFESSSVDILSSATIRHQELSASEARVVQLHRECNDLVQQLQRLEQKASIAQNDATSTRVALDSAERVVAALKRDLEMAHQEITLQGSSAERLNRVIAEHGEFQATASTQMLQLQNERSLLEITVRELTEQLHAAKQGAEEATKALAITVGELESVKQDLGAARQQAAKHESTFVKLKSSLKELAESETAASAHVLQLENERDLLVEKTEQLELKLVEMETHTITARTSAREYHEAMVAAWAELNAVKQSLVTAHQELQRRDERPKKAVREVSAPLGVLSAGESLVRRDHAARQLRQRQTSINDRARLLKRGGPLDEDTAYRSDYAGELTTPLLHGSRLGLPQSTDRVSKAVSMEIACVGNSDGQQSSKRMDRADLPPQHASDCAYREEATAGGLTSGCSSPPTETPQQVEDDGAAGPTTAMHGQIVDYSQSSTVGFERTNEDMTIEGKHVKEEEPPLGCKDPLKPPKQHQHAHTGPRDAPGFDKRVTHAKKLGQAVPTTTGSSVDFDSSEESEYVRKDLKAWAARSPSRKSTKRKLQEQCRTVTVSSELHSVVHECVTLLRRCIKDQSTCGVGDRSSTTRKATDTTITTTKSPPQGGARLHWTQVIDLNRLVWVLVEASKQTEELQVAMATKLEEVKARDAQLLRLERHCTELRQIVEAYYAQRPPRRQDHATNAPEARREDGSKWWLSPDHPVRGAGQSTAADPRLRALEKERRELNQRNVVMLERVIEQLKEASVARRRLHERLQLKTRSLDNAQRYCRGVCVQNLLLRAFYAWRLRTLR